ncbi:MAG: lysoplasmalogenase [Caulobacterales bacterium]|uniref:lysoplasmalogenase n=1 Tax=Glycocaulis sp. TaxID=1969725 RepID=UPI003F9F6D1D
MSDPSDEFSSANRYRETGPLIPAWTGPAYLGVAVFAAAVFLLLDQITGGGTQIALVKVSGIVLLALYAAFRKAFVLSLALVLSACGDFALALSPPAMEAGMGFFGAAHLAYLAIFAGFILKDGWRRDGLVLAAGLLAFGIAMYGWLRPAMGALEGPASAYLAVILAMAIASGLVRGPRLIVAGALLFLISDSLIAARLFREVLVFDGLDWGGIAVWITYFAAQFCLAVGIVRRSQQGAQG